MAENIENTIIKRLGLILVVKLISQRMLRKQKIVVN